jgi:hypothetical protein
MLIKSDTPDSMQSKGTPGFTISMIPQKLEFFASFEKKTDVELNVGLYSAQLIFGGLA